MIDSTDHHENTYDMDAKRIAEALLKFPTKAEAAEYLGISVSTLYRWRQSQDVREAEREARQLALSDATSSLQRLANEAAITLSLIMKSTAAPYSSRVAAASKLLDLAYRSYELEAVAGEIEDLKRELL